MPFSLSSVKSQNVLKLSALEQKVMAVIYLAPPSAAMLIQSTAVAALLFRERVEVAVVLSGGVS